MCVRGEEEAAWQALGHEQRVGKRVQHGALLDGLGVLSDDALAGAVAQLDLGAEWLHGVITRGAAEGSGAVAARVWALAERQHLALEKFVVSGDAGAGFWEFKAAKRTLSLKGVKSWVFGAMLRCRPRLGACCC